MPHRGLDEANELSYPGNIDVNNFKANLLFLLKLVRNREVVRKVWVQIVQDQFGFVVLNPLFRVVFLGTHLVKDHLRVAFG